MTNAKRTTWNDQNYLVLQAKSFNLMLGKSKCKLIVDNIDEIKLFVAENQVKTEVK